MPIQNMGSTGHVVAFVLVLTLLGHRTKGMLSTERRQRVKYVAKELFVNVSDISLTLHHLLLQTYSGSTFIQQLQPLISKKCLTSSTVVSLNAFLIDKLSQSCMFIILW